MSVHTQVWRMRPVVSLLVVLSGPLGLPRPSPAHVVEFTCAAGEVACLIEAINQANANGEATTITLEAGTYTLTAINNTTDGANGLPSVTGVVTIQGAGADATVIERDASAPGFRLVRVAATGSLTLQGLTLRQGRALSTRRWWRTALPKALAACVGVARWPCKTPSLRATRAVMARIALARSPRWATT